MTTPEIEAAIRAAWHRACDATPDRPERVRRLARGLAAILGDGSIWKARRIHILYLDHGVKVVNRAAITVATRSGFEALAVDERFRALDRALSRRGKPGRPGEAV